jgi:hypothetical protein
MNMYWTLARVRIEAFASSPLARTPNHSISLEALSFKTTTPYLTWNKAELDLRLIPFLRNRLSPMLSCPKRNSVPQKISEMPTSSLGASFLSWLVAELLATIMVYTHSSTNSSQTMLST